MKITNNGFSILMVLVLVSVLGSMSLFFLKEVDLKNKLLTSAQNDIDEIFLKKEVISALKNDVNCAASLADIRIDQSSGANAAKFSNASILQGIPVSFWTGDPRGIRTRKKITLSTNEIGICSPLYSPNCSESTENCNPGIECEDFIVEKFLGIKVLSLSLKKSPETVIYPGRGSFIGELTLEGEVQVAGSNITNIKTITTDLLIHYLELPDTTANANYKIIGCGDIISNDSAYKNYKCESSGSWVEQSFCGVIDREKCSLPGGVGDNVCCKNVPSGPCGNQAYYSCDGYKGEWIGPSGKCQRSLENECQGGQTHLGGTSLCCSSSPRAECQENPNKVLYTCSGGEWIASGGCSTESEYPIANEGDQRCYPHFPHVLCLSTQTLKNYKCNEATQSWVQQAGSCPKSSHSACLSGNFDGSSDLCCATPPTSSCLANTGSCVGSFESNSKCIGGSYTPKYGGTCTGSYTGREESGGTCIGSNESGVSGRCVYLPTPCFGNAESCPDQNGLYESICPEIIYSKILKFSSIEKCRENPPCYWLPQSVTDCSGESMNSSREVCEGPVDNQTRCKWIPEYSDENLACGANWNGLVSEETCAQQSENCNYDQAPSRSCSEHVTDIDCRQATIEEDATCTWTSSIPGGVINLSCQSLDRFSCSTIAGCNWIP